MIATLLLCWALQSVALIPQPARVDVTPGKYLNVRGGVPEAAVTICAAMRPEGYTLDIDRGGIRIQAGSPAGAFYARQTLSQLLPADPAAKPRLPYVHIEDAPAWDMRAMMLDCSRHFFTVPEIKRLLDILAAHKINTFHWHLTDSQGWRLEIKRYPELTRIGNYRPYTESWPTWKSDGVPVDGYYSQDDVREIVAYAAERFITVIPELDMPGHATAALASYPFLGCKGEGYHVLTKWVIDKDVYCPGKETTFEFLEGVIAEVAELFPGPWIHLGGDECKKDRWKSCPHCRQRIQDEHLPDEEALQSYFMRRVEQIVRRTGKKMLGWDELVQGGLSPTVALTCRFGEASVRKVMDHGNRVLLCPGSHCYFDYYQDADFKKEPRAHGAPRVTTVETVWSLDPKRIYSAREQEFILGLECNLWTEYVPDFSHLQYMLLPRLDAFSEAAWAQGERDWNDFRRRLDVQRQRYDAAGIRYAGHVFTR